MLLARQRLQTVPRFTHPSRTSSLPRRCLALHAVSGASDSSSGAVVKRSYRSHRSRSSPDAEDHSAAVAFLHTELGFTVEAANELGIRGASPGTTGALRHSRCEAWVTGLKQLANCDAAIVTAILQRYPSLLHSTFDQQRRDNIIALQEHLCDLKIPPPQQLAMLTHSPQLLMTPASTVKATGHFLLTLCHGDAAQLCRLLTRRPQTLCMTVGSIQEKLLWLTEDLGVTPRAALAMLPRLTTVSVAGTLKPRRQWLLQQAFTPAEVCHLAQLNPLLLYSDIALLGRRLHSLPQTLQTSPATVRALILRMPVLWSLDLTSHLQQLRLQYWQQELGYSLEELCASPSALHLALTDRLVRRSTFLRDVLRLPALTPSQLSAVLRQVDSGEGSRNFSSGASSLFTRHHLAVGASGSSASGSTSSTSTSTSSSSSSSSCDSSVGSSVQDLLRPLAAGLIQPAHQQAWLAALQSAPPLAVSSGSSSQQPQLFSVLYRIASDDWPLSPIYQKWATLEAAAVAEDKNERANANRAAISERARCKAARAQVKAVEPAPSSSAALEHVAMALPVANAAAAAPPPLLPPIVPPVKVRVAARGRAVAAPLSAPSSSAATTSTPTPAASKLSKPKKAKARLPADTAPRINASRSSKTAPEMAAGDAVQ